MKYADSTRKLIFESFVGPAMAQNISNVAYVHKFNEDVNFLLNDNNVSHS